MYDDALAEPVRLGDHRGRFVLIERGDQLAVLACLHTVHGDLDAVHAILHLHADLFDRFVLAGDETADRRVGHPDPGRIPVGQSLTRRQIATSRGYTWAVKQAEVDRVAYRQADLPS